MTSALCSAHKGAIAELAACNWLLAQGYEVFRNISGAGPADLVAWDRESGQMIRVDVKGRTDPPLRLDGTYSLNLRDSQVAAVHEVHLLYVIGTEVVGFFRRGPDSSGAESYWPFDRQEADREGR